MSLGTKPQTWGRGEAWDWGAVAPFPLKLTLPVMPPFIGYRAENIM